jgi:sulfur carrier protein ThiS
VNHSNTTPPPASPAEIMVEVHFFGGSQQFTRRLPPLAAATLPRLALPAGSTVDDVLRYLGVDTGGERPLVNINRYFERDNVVLRDGDRVHLYRTVVGG